MATILQLIKKVQLYIYKFPDLILRRSESEKIILAQFDRIYQLQTFKFINKLIP